MLLLERPVRRCDQLCRELESSMEAFSRELNTRLPDWAKLKFRGDGINEFIDALTGYKSTISIWLTASLSVIRPIKTELG